MGQQSACDACATPMTPDNRVRRKLQAWKIAVRPASLWVSMGPVLVGSALAHAIGSTLDWMLVAQLMLAAITMQAICNLQNDIGFHLRGGEGAGTRVGLPRASTLGLLTRRQIQSAVMGLALLSLVQGYALFTHRGWPVLVIGGLSLAAAASYMGGPRPVAYTAYGELVVLVFFGWVAVLGTQWMMAGRTTLVATMAASAVGAWAAAALAINNHRDAPHDETVGRRTFAVLHGPRASRLLFAALLLVPFGLLPPIAHLLASPWPMAAFAVAPLTHRLHRKFARARSGADYTETLVQAFKLGLLFNVLLALGIALSTAPRFG